MKPLLRALVVAVVLAVGVLVAPGTAAAAHTEVGYDVSYPQCDSTLPPVQAFAVVGVNGGLSTKANPCLADQLRWAARSTGSVPAQPEIQLYLNTANPGEVRDQVVTWPAAGDTPYGACGGDNDMACSWQYGYERARNSIVSFFTPAARAAQLASRPSHYTWWLDVETMNTWQSGSSEALARNRAALEGMTAYLLAEGGRVGVYSTSYQWAQIVGTVPSTSDLVGRDSWLAGATTLDQAEANCGRAPLVPGGRVVLTQYVPGSLDHDHSCI